MNFVKFLSPMERREGHSTVVSGEMRVTAKISEDFVVIVRREK